MTLDEAMQIMTAEITSILADNKPTVYIFGSVALEDFKLGWSDIDIAVLTEHEISERQANMLVALRQALLERYPGNPYFPLAFCRFSDISTTLPFCVSPARGLRFSIHSRGRSDMTSTLTAQS